jgi:hypothetical protein
MHNMTQILVFISYVFSSPFSIGIQKVGYENPSKVFFLGLVLLLDSPF